MQKSPKKKPPVQEVRKPVLIGSWHGKDAFRMGRKLWVSVLMVSVIYLFVGVMLSFDNLLLRAVLAVALVVGAAGYLYSSGSGEGAKDAAFSEILYQRRSEGKDIPDADLGRCFHPAKGFFAVLIGVAPFVVITAAFACLTQPVLYSLGALPGWVQNLMRQNEFGDALGYYATGAAVSWMDIYRVAVRAMVMPFVNVAVLMEGSAALWVERLSPVLICIAPIGYGFGYKKGLDVRARIHTGILIGDTKKKRRQRREKKRRQESKAPERLV